MDNPFLSINKIKEQEKNNLETEEKFNSESYRKAYESGVEALKSYDAIVKKHLQYLREAYNSIEYKYGDYGRMYGRKEGDDIINSHISDFVYEPGWKISYMKIGYWGWYYDNPHDEVNSRIWYYTIEIKYSENGELYLIIQNRHNRKTQCKLHEAELVEGLKKLYTSSI